MLAVKKSRRGVSILREIIYKASQDVNHLVSNSTASLSPQPKSQAGCMQLSSKIRLTKTEFMTG